MHQFNNLTWNFRSKLKISKRNLFLINNMCNSLLQDTVETGTFTVLIRTRVVNAQGTENTQLQNR